ncbi:hypothetical protein Tco_1573744 [Tanacetum coccineum]
MNYEPVTAGNQTNGDAGIETNVNAGQAGQEKASDHEVELDSLLVQQKEGYANSTNRDSIASLSVSTAGPKNTGIFNDAYNDREVGVEADLNNLETTMNVSPIPTTKIHKDHPKDQIIGDINSAT